MDLVTGRFRPALEEAFQSAFARLRRKDPLQPLAVVAPSQRLTEHLKSLALGAVPEGFAAVRFLNLFSLARILYEESASPGDRLLLDDLVPGRLLRSILRRHYSGERYLSRALRAPQSVLAAIHELKAAAVDPDRALEMLAGEDLGHEDAPKLAEILTLYKRYTQELRRRRIDERSDVVRKAVEHAPRSAFLGSLGHVLYYGFYDLDQNQLDLLQEVRRRVPVTVFFPWEDRPEYDFAREFLTTKLAPVAREVDRRPPPPGAPRISQVDASGADDEVWAAAKEVLGLADQGIPYAQIAVVARTLDPYIDRIESVFGDHQIPFHSSATRALIRDPAVSAARRLFSIGPLGRADVLDLLRSPYFRRDGGDPELWDQASRLMGIGQGASEWERRLGGARGKDFVYSRSGRAEEGRFVLPRLEVEGFWKAVAPLLEPAPAPRTWKALAAWALDHYRRLLIPDPRVERAIESLAELEGLAMEDPMETLDELLLGLSEPVGWHPDASVADGARGGVSVLDAMAARGLGFRGLVVLGMNERVFPRFILEDAFLRDAVRSRFEHRLGCRMPRKVEGYAEERLLFTLLLESSDRILLVHQRSDEKGRVQVPSSFLPPGPVTPIARRPAQRLAEAALELLTPREASLRTGQGEALGRAIGWDVSLLVNALGFLGVIESRGAPTPYDGVVDSREYWQSLAGYGISPTALEKLAECPFRYFASRMLDLEELEAPELEQELLPVEIGQIYHDVLERFRRPPGETLDRALESSFREVEARRSIRYPVLWEVEKERIDRVLRAFVQAEDVTVFKPQDCEVRLQAELPVEVGGRKSVTFRGILDRLDGGPKGAFRVIDYKRRRSSRFRSTMERGILEKKFYLQAPLYFLMAQKALGSVEVKNSKFVYAFIEDVLLGEDWELELEGSFWERRGEFDAMLQELLGTIPRGEFLIRPGEYCATCEFRTLCRKSHWPTRLRASPREKSPLGAGAREASPS
jgi:ATP-dependent helicase/nuclease subunit B